MCNDCCSLTDRADDPQTSIECGNAVGQTRQTRSRTKCCAADAIVGNLYRQLTVSHLSRHPRLGCVRVLGDVGQGLGSHEIGSTLDCRWEPIRCRANGNRQLRTGGQLVQCIGEAVGRED